MPIHSSSVAALQNSVVPSALRHLTAVCQIHLRPGSLHCNTTALRGGNSSSCHCSRGLCAILEYQQLQLCTQQLLMQVSKDQRLVLRPLRRSKGQVQKPQLRIRQRFVALIVGLPAATVSASNRKTSEGKH